MSTLKDARRRCQEACYCYCFFDQLPCSPFSLYKHLPAITELGALMQSCRSQYNFHFMRFEIKGTVTM